MSRFEGIVGRLEGGAGLRDDDALGLGGAALEYGFEGALFDFAFLAFPITTSASESTREKYEISVDAG